MPASLNHRLSPRRLCALAGLVMVPLLLVAGCADSPTEFDPDHPDPSLNSLDTRGGRVLQVVTVTDGVAAGSYSLRVGSDTRPIAPNDTVTLPRLGTAPAEVELLGVAPGCRVDGENPRLVALTRPGVTRTLFEVACGVTLPPAEAVIGTGGGEVGTEIPGGGTAILEIPPGALPGGITLRITALAPEDSERVRIRLEPAGLILTKPATLTVQLSEPAGPTDRVGLRWLGRNNAVPTRGEGSTVTAQLSFLGMPALESVPIALFDADAGDSWTAAFLGAELAESGEEAGVVTVDPQDQLQVAQLLALAVSTADAIITEDVRARVLAALMLVVSTEGGSGFSDAVATVCAAVDEAMTALESGPVNAPREIVSPLARRALTWEGIFQEARVDAEFPCRSGDPLTRIIATLEARFATLLDAAVSGLEGEGRSFAELLFSDLPRIMDLAGIIQTLGLSQTVEDLVDPVVTRLFDRAVLAARSLCTDRLGYDAFELLLGATDVGAFPDGLEARAFREIQLCGTDLSWEVVGEEGEVRGGGTATPGDALAENLPLVEVGARYGDRLVLRGRLDVLRCSATRTQALGERLVLRLFSEAPTEDFLTRRPDGPGVNARFIPAEGLEIPLNAMADRAPGEEGSEKRLEVRIFRESEGCDSVLVSGLSPAFGFVRARLTVLPLEIQPAVLPAADVGEAYIQQLTVFNGQASSTWEQTGGALPPGVELSVDGVIAGVPSALGSYTFEVAVTAGGASVSTEMTIEVQESTFLFSLTATPVAIFVEGGESQLCGFLRLASDGSPVVGATVRFSHEGPGSVTGASANIPTDEDGLSCTMYTAPTPLPDDETPVTIRAVATPSTVTDPLEATTVVRLGGDEEDVLQIVRKSLRPAVVDQIYLDTVTVTGGDADNRWFVDAGVLPPGIQLGNVSGRIIGTPTAEGDYPVRFRVTNGERSDTATLNIEVRPPLAIATESLPAAVLDAPYATTLQVSGGPDEVPAWGIASGSLPPGLTLSVLGGISGTPQALGDFPFVVRASAGGVTVTRELTLSVNSPIPSRLTVDLRAFGDPTLTISADPPIVFRNQFYSYILRASGPSDTDWTGSVQSRDGLIDCAATGGVVSGTCEAEFPSGTQVVLDAFPGEGTITEGINSFGCPQTYSPTRIGCAVTVTGETGVAVFFRTQRWSIVSGSLPEGLEFDLRTGLISGNAFLALSGTYTVTFRVTAGGQSAQSTVSFEVF